MQTTRRWATKKQGASRARQKRRPAGKRFGLKKYPGEFVKQGDILVKQRGSKNHPGQNVYFIVNMYICDTDVCAGGNGS